jgi:hypothetical protein
MHTHLQPDAALEHSLLVARDLVERLARTITAAYPRPDSGHVTWRHVCAAQEVNRRLAQALAQVERAEREE